VTPQPAARCSGGSLGFASSGPDLPSHMFVVVLAAFLLSAEAPATPLVEGLDHTPVAVTDLDRAANDFAKLGFIIKPGRPHKDGIRNKHVKFPNGGEIELITASSPTDALAKEYVAWLRGGEGPASWSLYAPDLAAVTAFLSRRQLQPNDEGDVVTYSQAAVAHRLFFADRLRSPTDGPIYWAHPNTAYKLRRVWLAGSPSEVDLVVKLGAEVEPRAACSPFDSQATVYVLPREGDEIAVAPNVRRSQARNLIGVTVRVRSIAAARRILEKNHVPIVRPASCRSDSLWVGPSSAHGLWLEFAQGEMHREFR